MTYKIYIIPIIRFPWGEGKDNTYVIGQARSNKKEHLNKAFTPAGLLRMGFQPYFCLVLRRIDAFNV